MALQPASSLPRTIIQDLPDYKACVVVGAGLIDSTTTPSRQMQVGLKLIW